MTTLNDPIMIEHMRKLVALDGELVLTEGSNHLMILEAHLQLVAIALVAAAEYNYDRVALMFNEASKQLLVMVHEELANKPLNITPVSGNSTVN